MTVAWSIGGVVGPQIAAALIGENKNYATAYTVIAVIALVSLVLPFITKIPRKRESAEEGYLGEVAST